MILDDLRHFRDVRSIGNDRWTAYCPCCESDKTTGDQHLGIAEGEDGKLLAHCLHGCEFEAILKGAGLFGNNGFGKDKSRHEPVARPPKVTPRTKSRAYASIDEAAASLAQSTGGVLAGCQTYTGNFTILRFNLPSTDEHGKPDKTFRPIHRDADGWRAGDPSGPLPLYAADRLPTEGLVFIVEGETCADAIESLGLTGLTSAHGSSAPRKSAWGLLAGRDVAIWPDADIPGRKYAEAVAKILSALDPPASVRIIEPPDELPAGGDVVDWLEYRDAQETEDIIGEILRMAEAASVWKTTENADETQVKEAKISRMDFAGCHLTQQGTAERFVQVFGENFRWCEPWNSWLMWDGRRWARDAALHAQRTAMLLPQLITQEAADEQDSDRRKALRDWANACERISTIRGILEFTKPLLAVTPDNFDKETWVLNVQNGTVDLKTGELKPHNKDDLITKLAPVAYDPKALCPRWETFLAEIFNNNIPLIDFVGRLAGYWLTGDISEHIFPVFFGTGRNGKSVFLDTILGFMGDYGCKAPASLLTVRHSEEHPTELAKLHGMRFVVGSETEQGAHLRIQLVKEMTGDSTLTGRYMRTDYFDFPRTFKLLLVTNHRPHIRDDSAAAWERVKLMPFTVQFLEGTERPPDKHLLEKLKAEWPGILAWAVQGNLARLESGMPAPESVKAATAEYRADEDPLAGFLGEVAALDPEAWTPVAQLKEAFEGASELRWGRLVTDRLKTMECKSQANRVAGKVVRGWYGIKLL